MCSLKTARLYALGREKRLGRGLATYCPAEFSARSLTLHLKTRAGRAWSTQGMPFQGGGWSSRSQCARRVKDPCRRRHLPRRAGRAVPLWRRRGPRPCHLSGAVAAAVVAHRGLWRPLGRAPGRQRHVPRWAGEGEHRTRGRLPRLSSGQQKREAQARRARRPWSHRLSSPSKPNASE